MSEKKPSLARTLAVIGGSTAAGVGTGLLLKRLMGKFPTRPGVGKAVMMALPPAVTLGLLLASRRDKEIKKHATHRALLR